MKEATKIKRKIIKIDEQKCDGCGLCVTACAEGALQIMDGKARLISDKYCDGLGACLPECPQNAISFEERAAETFDAEAAHEHISSLRKEEKVLPCGCPGSAVRQFGKVSKDSGTCQSTKIVQFPGKVVKVKVAPEDGSGQPSELGHWPVQLTLVPPTAPFLQGADLLLAADCTAFAYGGFHRDFLKDRALIIACPKLDNFEAHQNKLNQIVSQSDIRSLTVLRMEVPCCSGLTRMAMQAILSGNKDIPFKETVITADGNIRS